MAKSTLVTSLAVWDACEVCLSLWFIVSCIITSQSVSAFLCGACVFAHAYCGQSLHDRTNGQLTEYHSEAYSLAFWPLQSKADS